MKAFSKIFIYLLGSLFALSSLRAEQKDICPICPPVKSGKELKCAYNASSRIDVVGAWDFFANVSFIYWQGKENGLELGMINSNETCPLGKLLNIDFTYHPGFKLGLGMHSDHDNWHLYAEYTRFHTSDINSFDLCDPCSCSDCETISPTWINIKSEKDEVDLFEAKSASGKWRLHLDLVDLQLGRPCFIGTKLTFNPFFGIRGGWIDQSMHTKYDLYSKTDPNLCDCDFFANIFAYSKSTSWLLGPRAGLNTEWLFKCGFRFIGTCAFNLMYQNFHVKAKDCICECPCSLLPKDTLWNYNNRDKNGLITPNLETALGFGWGTYFDEHNWFFDISARYEFQTFWNQNMMRHLKDLSIREDNGPIGDNNAADLFFHGLTVTARLEF